MGKAKWASGKFSLAENHEKAASVRDNVLLAELLKSECVTKRGISVNCLQLYQRLGERDFCTPEEFRTLVDQLCASGCIYDPSYGESGEKPVALSAEGRSMALAQRDALQGKTDTSVGGNEAV